MAFVKYESEFFSQNPSSPASRWKVRIHKKTGTGSTTNFTLGSDGFVLKMDGGDDTVLSPIKTTSCEFTFVIENGNTNQEAIIDDILTVAQDNEGELALEIQRYNNTIGGYRRYWVGVILGDLSELDDVSPNNFIRIKAVDGLAQLKYKQFPTEKEGNRSCLYYIKAGLMEITTSLDEFGFWTEGSAETENFLTHQAFYYNLSMGNVSSSSWRDDLDHDPLALTKLNSLVFKNKDGQYWSYYKIIENIVAAFQLRLMMTPIRDDFSSGGGSFFNGNMTWLLQSPLAYHSAADNSSRDTSHYFFLHKKSLDTDVALSYELISHNVVNPKTHIAGTKQKFIPPLLSYKCIYDHKNFLGLSLGPMTIQTAWSTVECTGGTVSESANGFTQVRTSGLGGLYQLQGINNEAPQFGWTGDNNQKSSNARIVITGNCTLAPKFHSFLASGQDASLNVGYDSAGDYWGFYGGELAPGGNGWYQLLDDAVIMPRLALKVETLVADPDGDFTINGGDGTKFRLEAFWLGDRRFGTLAGATPWGRRRTVAGTLGFSSEEQLNIQSGQVLGLYGYNGQWGGIQYIFSNPSNTSYFFNGIQQWGTDIGYSDMYWWNTTNNSGGPNAGFQTPLQENHHAFFSPVYFKSQVQILNGTNNSAANSWDNGVWTSQVSEFINHQTFTITSPRIPVGKQLNGDNYGANYINKVRLYCLLNCDDAVLPNGNKQRAACKSWDFAVLDTGGTSSDPDGGFGTQARGIQWDYYLSDTRINITGINSGVDSFDTTIAEYINSNGSPSEQFTQEPDIVIGDNPPEDPFAWNESSGTAGFGGEYPGVFKIHTSANDLSNPQTGPDTQNWRALWDVGAAVAGDVLHKQRAKNALAHYFMIKRGLQITFSDRTTSHEIEEKLASGFYYYLSGKWEENQAGANIGFLVNGFEFVAGSGLITLDLEDVVTFNRSNLTDNTYSTNG